MAEMNLTSIESHYWEKSMKNFGIFDYVVFTFMLVACSAVGLYYAIRGRKVADAESEFLMGGRNMNTFPIAMSLVASFVSGISLLGIPTEAYIYGIQYFFILIIFISISSLASYIFLPVFFRMQLSSTYEYLEKRFDRKLRYLGAILFTIGLISWLPIVIYVPALAFNQVTGMNIHIITPCVCLICIFYTAVGGLKAVVWTDVIQTVIMIGAMLLVVIKGSLDIGGFHLVLSRAWESGRIELPSFKLDFSERHTIWSLTVGGSVFWLQAAFLNQNMIQRYLSLPHMKQVRRALWTFVLGTAGITLLCAYAGLVVYSTYHDCDPLTTKVAKAKDQLLPLLVTRVLGQFPGMPGLFVAGIFSAALSSLSTGLNSMSAIVLEDFVKPVISKKLSNRETEIIMKSVVLIFGVVCVALVFVVEKLGTVLQLSMSLGAMTSGPLFGVFCLGILFPWANDKGAFYGGLIGILFTTVIVCGGQQAQAKGYLVYPGKPVSIEGCLNFFNSSIVIGNQTTTTGDEYVFPLYKISYLWYSVFGALCTFVLGVIISYFTGPTDLTKLDQMYISPPLRKYLPRKPAYEKGTEDLPESVKMLDKKANDGIHLENT